VEFIVNNPAKCFVPTYTSKQQFNRQEKETSHNPNKQSFSSSSPSAINLSNPKKDFCYKRRIIPASNPSIERSSSDIKIITFFNSKVSNPENQSHSFSNRFLQKNK
jgi:hypothetical protein